MTSATTARRDEIVSSRNGQPIRGEAFGERLRSRDPEALERFFDLYFDSIHGRVRGLVHSTREAEDLTQDIFLNIRRSLPSYNPKRSLHAWVSAIAINRIRDHWRSRRRVRKPDRDDDSTASSPFWSERPASELERQERDDEIKEAVYELPLDMRSVLLLRIYDGLAFKTIGKIMKLSPAAARKRYSRALNLLLRSLSLEGVRL